MTTAPLREPVDGLTDRVTYFGDDGEGNEVIACISFEPNEAEAAKQAAELEEAKAAAEKTAAAVDVLAQQADSDTKNPPAADVQKSLVDIVLDLQARVAKLEETA
jgi:hypothetical protein